MRTTRSEKLSRRAFVLTVLAMTSHFAWAGRGRARWAVAGWSDGTQSTDGPLSDEQAALVERLFPPAAGPSGPPGSASPGAAPADFVVPADGSIPPQYGAGKVTAFEYGGRWQVHNLTPPDGATLTAYGDPAKGRPVLFAPAEHVLFVRGGRDVTIRNLALVGNRRSHVAQTIDCRTLALCGCEVTGGSFAITFEGSRQTPRPSGCLVSGCYVHDNFHEVQPGNDASGFFASNADGIVLEDNIFDCNGWDRLRPATKTVRNHHVYIHGACGPATIRRNLFAFPSSHAVQARSGGAIENNLVYMAPLGIDFGVVGGGGPPHAGGVTGRVAGNVIVGGSDIGAQLRGVPFEVGNVLDADFENNLVAGFPRVPGYAAINIERCIPDPRGADWSVDCVGIVRLRLTGNKVWRWGGKAMAYGGGVRDAGPGKRGNSYVQSIVQTDNVFMPQSPGADVVAMLGDPVRRVCAGEKVTDLIAACAEKAPTT